MSWINIVELCMVCARERLHAGEAVLGWLDEFRIERLAPDRDVVWWSPPRRGRAFRSTSTIVSLTPTRGC